MAHELRTSKHSVGAISNKKTLREKLVLNIVYSQCLLYNYTPHLCLNIRYKLQTYIYDRNAGRNKLSDAALSEYSLSVYYR